MKGPALATYFCLLSDSWCEWSRHLAWAWKAKPMTKKRDMKQGQDLGSVKPAGEGQKQKQQRHPPFSSGFLGSLQAPAVFFFRVLGCQAQCPSPRHPSISIKARLRRRGASQGLGCVGWLGRPKREAPKTPGARGPKHRKSASHHA